MGLPADELASRQVTAVSAFVTRARRVEEHSLASDKERLFRWAEGTMTFRHFSDGRAMVRVNTPDEEALDSMGARCRPFVLKKDPVHYAKVMKAVKYFVRGSDLQEPAEDQTFRWRRLDPESEDLIAYGVRASVEDGAFSATASDKVLAYAWLYGDLVHADAAAISRVEPHDIDARFQPGSLIICNLAVCAISTLNLVRAARDRGLIALDDSLFSKPVLAQPPRWLPVSKMATAPVGTPMSDIEALLDAEDVG
jgi:hypothetical protein